MASTWKGRCEDPECPHKQRTVDLYYHSTEYYYPELYEETGKKWYKACGTCVERDYVLFDNDKIS